MGGAERGHRQGRSMGVKHRSRCGGVRISTTAQKGYGCNVWQVALRVNVFIHTTSHLPLWPSLTASFSGMTYDPMARTVWPEAEASADSSRPAVVPRRRSMAPTGDNTAHDTQVSNYTPSSQHNQDEAFQLVGWLPYQFLLLPHLIHGLPHSHRDRWDSPIPNVPYCKKGISIGEQADTQGPMSYFLC